jgi:hypothetical protein
LAIAALTGWLRSAPSPATPAADAALLALRTRGDRTRPVELVIHRDFAGRLSVRAGDFPAGREIVHAPDAAVRGCLLANDDWLVVAQHEDHGDLSFSSSLWRSNSRGLTRVFDDVALASRPVIAGRRAYVQRGRVGVATGAGAMREDDVWISELDVDAGASRTVVSLRGQLAFPIGVDADAGLIAYLIGGTNTIGEGGRLVSISLSTLTPRDLGSIGTARDFSLAPQALLDGRSLGPAIVFEAIRPGSRSVITRALSGEEIISRRSPTTPLAPFVLPGGQVQMTQRSDDGGWDVVRAYSSTLHAVLLARYRHARPLPSWIVRATDGSSEVELDDGSSGTRFEPMGFAEPR